MRGYKNEQVHTNLCCMKATQRCVPFSRCYQIKSSRVNYTRQDQITGKIIKFEQKFPQHRLPKTYVTLAYISYENITCRLIEHSAVFPNHHLTSLSSAFPRYLITKNKFSCMYFNHSFCFLPSKVSSPQISIQCFLCKFTTSSLFLKVIQYLLTPSSSSSCHKCLFELDVRGSVHHSIIHKEKSNKMQQCIKILLFHTYMKLSMFRTANRPSSGA